MNNKQKHKSIRLLASAEDSFFQWASMNSHEIVRFFALSGILMVLSLLPYINLFFNDVLLLFLVFFVALIIFKVSGLRIISFSFFLLIFTIPLVLLKRFEAAEIIVNFIYGFLLLAVFKITISDGVGR